MKTINCIVEGPRVFKVPRASKRKLKRLTETAISILFARGFDIAGRAYLNCEEFANVDFDTHVVKISLFGYKIVKR